VEDLVHLDSGGDQWLWSTVAAALVDAAIPETPAVDA